ncbi:hypothetical protein OEZ86_007967 [Tetradesmus obliquus]|nr:hypothetical protein OEZ86_007967 [Tetradesmus obliquus]
MVCAEHTFSLVHRPGATNPADMPSRHPLPSITDPSGARIDKTGNNGAFTDVQDLPPEVSQPAICRPERLHQAAQRWVTAATSNAATSDQPAPLPVRQAFSLPQDIKELKTSHLIAAGATNPKHPWLVVAGWPCQDLSRAGTGAGLQGEAASQPHTWQRHNCYRMAHSQKARRQQRKAE